MLRPLNALLLALSAALFSKGQGLRVVTENGPIVGTTGISFGGFKFLAYKGIPYAEPPTGINRFKEPRRLGTRWSGDRNAMKYGNPCIQLNEFSRQKLPNNTFHFDVTGAEDCLYLNIFTREGGPSQKDVIFFIHGGAFMYGAGDQYGPEYIMDNDQVVFINFNYRLGPFGFLTTGDSVVPGNNGLRDQVAALEWVRRNIANFGGDPNKITIVGASAGGASVDYMFLTPLTNGMFTKGFAMSGSSLCAWGLVTNGVERTKELATGLGCPTTTSLAMVACLTLKSAKDIAGQQRAMLTFLYNPFTLFGPVVEVGSARPYLDKHPREIKRQGLDKKLPWLAGVAAQEGLYPSAEFITDPELVRIVNQNWTTIGPALTFLNPKLPKEIAASTISEVRRHYFGDKPIDISTRQDLVRMLTDRDFAAGIVETAQLRQGSHVYQYAYQGATSFAMFMSDTKERLGASHLDDASQLLNETFDESHTTPRDRQIASVMHEILFSFVLKGKVPEKYNWPVFSQSRAGSYLRISSPANIAVTSDPIVNLETQNKLYNVGSTNDQDRLTDLRALTENGPVVGTTGTSYRGFTFKAFKGIPYAKPPTGANRFKEPQRLNTVWTNERDATEFGNICLQLNEFDRKKLPNNTVDYHLNGDEDCLFINVYTRADGPRNKDVIFFIHGGAFMYGSANKYGPEYIMDNDKVVYVNFNYRLGVLGFLTTGDNVVPGNNGLKDQVAALEWVHRNIANFGGDPRKITIVGASAGGASVDYMFLTPLTNGMFNRGFAMSGSSLVPWALVTNGVERSKKLTAGVGCPITSSQAMLDCLRSMPADKIVKQQQALLVFLYNPFTLFGPVVEVGSARPYIDKHPREIIRQGLAKNLPWVAGVAAQDGLYPSAEFITDKALLSMVNNDWTTIGPALTFLNPALPKEVAAETINTVRQHYFGDKPINIATRQNLVQMLTDRDFAAGIVETATNRPGAHLYQYAHQAAKSFAMTISGTDERLGASHLDDASNIINESFVQSHTTARDREVSEIYNGIFFEFILEGRVPAKYNWPPIQSGSYLRINSADDVFVTNKPIVNLELQKRLYKQESRSDDSGATSIDSQNNYGTATAIASESSSYASASAIAGSRATSIADSSAGTFSGNVLNLKLENYVGSNPRTGSAAVASATGSSAAVASATAGGSSAGATSATAGGSSAAFTSATAVGNSAVASASSSA